MTAQRHVTAATKAERREELYALLKQTASKGHSCPSLASIGALLHIHDTTAAKLLEDLRKAGRISWTIRKGIGVSTVRVVTIAETGRSTAAPRQDNRSRNASPRPAFVPTLSGCPVRVLTGAELLARKQELEARDAEQRRRAAI